jgi:hypothetical protein
MDSDEETINVYRVLIHEPFGHILRHFRMRWEDNTEKGIRK